ncbi:3-hydroxyacyl-CoA dehydrogenase NAD-binding domain-containing protein [Testudinibacter sp. TR-2022]|uniref:3-hydroxyacyl-CoA dehydrogenase NAD-binding domain-containing protein n=1 Tax=Testudinibacter sp. TR-2022 TaxID=2585029 RepID=UPI001117B944|nr:3-hydroxyacyl-CoA dehydrogenase NAD-binding domain-containing protein [Testudinibacter sp. TR-2022]TNH05674.1 fatty-acid oxidation protein subunit alpha [Pasteurellaceae bacterium Phil11]TNH22307.1 fatty-acid oxidation protein subunit alpha [Testudinibacter sp. TR-2022]TNH25044.1 fatty-acid oxidation protein subunit alpha [Testudinibacter sp. TR-2022]
MQTDYQIVAKAEYQNDAHADLFRLSFYQDNIAVIAFNISAKKQNWLDERFIAHLQALLDQLPAWQLRGVIFVSSKENSFVQGFSLSPLEQKSDAELYQFSQQCQHLIQKIKALTVPTICALQGSCFGFGLELALACDYRLATDDIETSFAMPQVKSGILPFAGGCALLTAQIGLKSGLLMLLSGNKISVNRALEKGLIDEVVPKAILFQVAVNHINNQMSSTLQNVKKGYHRLRFKAENIAWLRRYLIEQVEQQVWLKAFDNYPATKAIIQLFKQRQEALPSAESDCFVMLFGNKTSAVLRRMEQTNREMRHQYHDLQSDDKIKKVAVLGSGFMGAGIAYITAARAGLPVRIKDINPDGVQKALRLSYLLLQKEVDRGHLPYGKLLQKIYLISGGERFIGKQTADIVIESVYEDLQLKQNLIEESESYYDKNTIFASNTLTLSIAEIAAKAQRPQNVIGVHYFTPVSQRRMVEIVPHFLQRNVQGKLSPQGTSQQTIAKAISLVIEQGQVPLLVKDSPGFFINRVLIPYLLEAYYCVLDGEAVGTIDRALQEFGFSVGPLAMIDEMGLDILVKALPTLERRFGIRFALPHKVEQLLLNERKGRKNRRGFYLYHSRSGNRTQVDKSIYQVLDTTVENNLEPEQIVRRCILMMLNEAAYCVQEQIISNQNEGNVASVLGMFFPEFRGGIYAYMRDVGAATIVAELELMMAQHGERFRPCPWLVQQAAEEQVAQSMAEPTAL